MRKQAGAADHLGLNPSVPATCFPTAATVACSWDPALGEQVGQAMGEEAAAQEVAVLLGPGLNTKRSPLCGRNFEYFSEDPYPLRQDGRSLCARHPVQRYLRLPQALCRQQPGAAPHGVATPWWMSAPCGSCT
ncbi:glycoside hydrolase family 3 N-terminal domain-containing protein [Gemmiger formicilis]|uniref:glycoside hydrolase family 3 N-terminal domain-containing protein n=1 Tax=Gemmiger formicilis TaxID=745368 RepID=UPI00352099B0